MNSFKIATWNVNSLRVRLPHVLTWLSNTKPDVLALQETKVTDEDFPYAAIEQAGYVAVSSGQKTYNGVAVLWREKALEMTTGFPDFDDPQRRILGVSVGDIRVLNLYVPNGESVTSQKYQYKMNWLSYLRAFLKEEIKKYPKLIMLGDFNIAPEEIDVHDVTLWEGKVLFSMPERDAFKEILQIGFNDCYRTLNPAEKTFSWWDYRVNAFKRDMGVRIDHILASQSLASSCVKCYTDKAPRGWERPSDHAPVMAEFLLS